MLNYDTKKWTHVAITAEKLGGASFNTNNTKPRVNIPTVKIPTVNMPTVNKKQTKTTHPWHAIRASAVADN